MVWAWWLEGMSSCHRWGITLIPLTLKCTSSAWGAGWSWYDFQAPRRHLLSLKLSWCRLPDLWLWVSQLIWTSRHTSSSLHWWWCPGEHFKILKIYNLGIHIFSSSRGRCLQCHIRSDIWRDVKNREGKKTFRFDRTVIIHPWITNNRWSGPGGCFSDSCHWSDRLVDDLKTVSFFFLKHWGIILVAKLTVNTLKWQIDSWFNCDLHIDQIQNLINWSGYHFLNFLLIYRFKTGYRSRDEANSGMDGKCMTLNWTFPLYCASWNNDFFGSPSYFCMYFWCLTSIFVPNYILWAI